MAVEDVFAPKPTNPSDPKKPNDKDEGKSEWKKKAEDAKSEREYLEEQRRIDRMNQPEQPPQEPPFKMSGEFNLGKVDLQEQQRQAKEEAERMRQEKDKELKDERQKREQTEKELHNAELVAVQTTLTQKIENLERSVRDGMSQKNFAQQAAEIRELATELGFQKPDPSLAGAGDANTRLELAKLNMDEKRLDREFKWKMRQDEKQWQLELQKIQDTREAKQAELTIKSEEAKKSREFWDNLPKTLGGAIGQGYLARQSDRRVTEEATPEPKAPKGKQARHVEAGWGESGNVECPGCDQPIFIPPTGRVAVCANCGEKVPIRRIGEKPSIPEEE